MTPRRLRRQDMSARQVDRVELAVKRLVAITCGEDVCPAGVGECPTLEIMRRRLTRLLASVQRSERR